MLTGCASLHKEKKEKDTWVGYPINDLIYYSGFSPTSRMTLGDGRQIVKFKHSDRVIDSKVTCVITFYVNSNGLIDSYKYEGDWLAKVKFFSRCPVPKYTSQPKETGVVHY